MTFSPVPEVPTHKVVQLHPKRCGFCVCIPVINEGKRLHSQLSALQREGTSRYADIIILDGGSTDGSVEPETLRAFGCTSLLIKTGPGKLSAQLRMGYLFALQQEYLGVITIDGNGKDSVSSIPAFVEKLRAGIDLIQGSRYVPGGLAENTPWYRLLAIKCIHVPITRLASGFSYTDTTNGFRGYSAKLLADPRLAIFREVFDTYELLAYLSITAPRLGYSTIELPVERRYPKGVPPPTKIKGVSANISLLLILLRAALGRYAPS